MTDRYLQDLWSHAARVAKGEYCYNPECGRPAHSVHHIVRKRRRVLRFDITNAMPLCKECHDKAHKVNGWERDFLSAEDKAYLDERALINVKDWILKLGMSMLEFEKFEADTLKRIIKGE